MSTFTTDDLSGRTARCTCGEQKPSVDAVNEPFFEYRGPGTQDNICAKCFYAKIAHEYEAGRVSPEPAKLTRDHDFTPMREGYEFDTYLCADYDRHPGALD